MTHAELVVAIAQYLRLTGWYVIQLPKGGVPGLRGLPDLLAFKAPRVLPVEAKVGPDKMSAEQRIVAEHFTFAGYPVLEARSLDDVMGVTR